MRKIIIFLIVGFLIFSLYIQLPDIYQYDSKRILQLLVLLTIGILLLIPILKSLSKGHSLNSLKFPESKLILASVILLFVAGLISVILASNFRNALLEFSFFFILFSLVLILAPTNLRQHYFFGKVISATALIFSALYVVIFLGNYISSFYNPMIAVWPERYDFTITIDDVVLVGKEVLFFDNVRFFNQIQTWTLPIIVGFIAYFKTLKKNITFEFLLVLLASFWWMLLFATGGRGTILGTLLSLIILLFIFKREAYQLLKNGVVTFFVGGLFYTIFFKVIASDVKTTSLARNFSSGSKRLELWGNALKTWLDTPFFGVGPMHNAKMSSAGPDYAHVHNFYLQILSEWGSIAFFALVVLIVMFLYSIFKNYSKANRSASNKIIFITFTWALTAGLIHAFVSGVMMTPMSQMWAVMLLAWFLGFSNRILMNKQFLQIKYIHGLYIIFLVTILWLVSDDIFNLQEIYREYLMKYPNSILYPRFWGQGLFE